MLTGSQKIGLAAQAFNMLEAVTSVGSQKRGSKGEDGTNPPRIVERDLIQAEGLGK